MEVRSYNAELAIANILFKRIFSNIVIERVDRKTGDKKMFPVTCVLEQRSRILKNWENAEKRATYKLPLIAINRTGYTRVPDRVNGIHNEVKYEISSKNRNENLLTPVPVDISYDVTIMSRYQSDIDQIASNFMVFFNSDVYVSCIHPKYEGIKLNNQIIMSDGITEEHLGELDPTADDFVTSTFQFTFKTYLFGGMKQAKLEAPKVLSTYLSTFLSTYVIELQQEEISSFCAENPDAKLSATITEEVTAEVTAYVTDPSADIGDETYDGFVPIAAQIDVGFYAVAQSSGFVEFMETVDSYPLSAQPYYVDRIHWKIDNMISAG